MLAAVEHRGERTDVLEMPGVALGVRWWATGGDGGIHRGGTLAGACAGSLAPPVASAAAQLSELIRRGESLDALDGAFASAVWESGPERLTLLVDPFGVRSIHLAEHRGALYFASELKALLAIPELPVVLDPVAVHKYLTFSFVPGDATPLVGVRRLLPGHLLIREPGAERMLRYFALREDLDPALAEPRAAARAVRAEWREAVARRLGSEREVALYLSGGVDSSGVGAWLAEAGVQVRAFSLDFGERSVEREQAETVAAHLGFPLALVKVGGEDLASELSTLAWHLDMPFGDPVTGPLYLLGRAARAAGLDVAFNGEGGDQLFGGWTTKPMVAAELYADLYADDTREQTYLKSYHRFYGREEQLYAPAFRARVGGPGQRRAHLAPFLAGEQASTFLHRVRLADVSLKGSQNILPRAERMAAAWALDLQAPLFDRALAELSFRLPPQLKLRGATEKYVLKLAVGRRLPREIVWRRKFGMSVPITDWALGPLAPVLEDLLGPRAIEARGLFNEPYVSRLRRGQNDPDETRRRRIGERLWTLAMLEAWLRVFVDGRGRRP
jgi:asparagine synthase (glutamine-hydrolysing)